MRHSKNLLTLFIYLLIIIQSTQAQQRVMTIHMNNGITHQYMFTDVDSVSFAELAEVLPNIEQGTQMMVPEMQDNEKCNEYYSLTDHYLHAKNKDIYENVFESSLAGQYALMPIEKEKMVMLYGGGKYLVTKYGCNNPEALYDENLNPVCAFSMQRGNATYEKSVMTFTIDLTDKEGVYYLRRFVRLKYANKSSVVAIEEFTPKGSTADVKILNANISRFNKEGNGTKIPISKSQCRVSFDFTINADVNTDGEAIKIADIDMVGNNCSVSVLRRSPQQMKIRYYGDNESVKMADAQDVAFKSGFIIGKDTIVRSQDFYKPLAGDPYLMLWLQAEEYEEEPTEEELIAHEESLKQYINYYISLENKELALFDGDTKVASIALSDGMTVESLCNAVAANTAFKDFQIHPLVGPKTAINSLMSFPKIHLVGSYYQSFDIKNASHIKAFDYHYDSYPVVLREAVDTRVHTFDAVMTDEGVFIGIDGDFALIDYDIINHITISDNFTVNNIDVVDGEIKDVLKKFSGTSRIYSKAQIITPRSPALLGLMGHHVEPSSTEGYVPNASSDVSSERLSKMCQIMKEEGYKTLNMNELVEYMDSGMKGDGLHAFYMFDDFRIDALYVEESTRNIFIDNGLKANLALIHSYLWEGSSSNKYGKYIQPMNDLGWSCVSHSLRHNQPFAKKPSVYINYEIKQCHKECEQWGINSEVFVYNWDGTWSPGDILFIKNGIKYAINSRGSKCATLSTNPLRLPRRSFQEALEFNTIEKLLRW